MYVCIIITQQPTIPLQALKALPNRCHSCHGVDTCVRPLNAVCSPWGRGRASSRSAGVLQLPQRRTELGTTRNSALATGPSRHHIHLCVTTIMGSAISAVCKYLMLMMWLESFYKVLVTTQYCIKIMYIRWSRKICKCTTWKSCTRISSDSCDSHTVLCCRQLFCEVVLLKCFSTHVCM